MSRLTLKEHTETTMALAVEDVDYLLEFSKRWRFVWPAPGGKIAINPGSTVGLLRLPSGTQVEIRPKVPLRNLIWMLCEANGLTLETTPGQVDVEHFDELVELLADTFTRMVERRIDFGLYRNYLEEEADLPAVRGRILVGEDVRRNAVLRYRTYCRFTTYSWDLPENQVMRQVVCQLAGWGFSHELTSRLLALDRQLDEVTSGRFAPEDIDRFVYTRQSEDYRPIHRLCRLFLECASASERSGDLPLDGFLLDMNALFETFVTASIRARLDPKLKLHEQVRTSLDSDGAVGIRPDVVITRRGDAILVADCKYKVLGHEEHRQHDLYQLLAHATAFAIREGTLIYPRHLVNLGTTIRVRNSGARLHETTVDLGGEVAHVRAELDALARRLERWADFAAGTVQRERASSAGEMSL